MSPKAGLVLQEPPHRINRGDGPMEQKYDATYIIGKTTVHIAAPPPMTQEEIDRRVREFHIAGWNAWNSLPIEERLRINSESEQQE